MRVPSIDVASLHERRYSHATPLLRAGVPVHIVVKRLGHEDPSVGPDVYANAIPADDGHAAETFARAPGPREGGCRPSWQTLSNAAPAPG